MPLLVYRPRNFDQTHEREQFRNLCILLKERFYSSPEETCIFIGNYNIGDVELDGIIIKDDGIILVEFKDYGGNITATENGDWISESNGEKSTIRGGSGRKNPYLQAKINRNASKPVLAESGAFSSKQLERISSLIVFHHPTKINNLISPRIKWLRICDEQGFIDEVDLIATPNCDLQRDDYRKIIDRLALDSDWLCVRYSNVEVLKEEKTESKHTLIQDVPLVRSEIVLTQNAEIIDNPNEEKPLDSPISIQAEEAQKDFVSYVEKVFSALGISGRFIVIDLKNNTIPPWVKPSQPTNEFLVATTCVAFKNKLKRFLFKPVYEQEGVLYWFDGEPLGESFAPRHEQDVGNSTGKETITECIENPYQLKTSTRLPLWLDNLIYEDCKARWESDPHKFEANLLSSLSDNLVYLGTYFPRSYADAFCIFENLFSVDAYKAILDKKESLNILSIGCGTGGDAIGLMTGLVKHFSHLKNINFYAIDGNDFALDLFKKVFDRFCEVSKIDSHLFVKREVIEDFSKIELDPWSVEGFDFILSSKMIGEVISAGKGSLDNSYYIFGKRFLPELSIDGVCLILDVTTKPSHSSLFYPQLMSEQLNRLIREEMTFKIISPLCCSKYSNQCYDTKCFQQKEFSISHSKKLGDKCRVSYRIIARQELVDHILVIDGDQRMSVSETNVCSFTRDFDTEVDPYVLQNPQTFF